MSPHARTQKLACKNNPRCPHSATSHLLVGSYVVVSRPTEGGGRGNKQCFRIKSPLSLTHSLSLTLSLYRNSLEADCCCSKCCKGLPTATSSSTVIAQDDNTQSCHCICMYICMYACMYVCRYAHIYYAHIYSLRARSYANTH